jgi:hypothetical protein
MKPVIVSLLLAATVLAATVLATPALARSASRNAAQNQGNAVYQDRSRAYQNGTGARIHQHGIDPDPPAFGRFTPEQQRIIDAISRADRFGPQ